MNERDLKSGLRQLSHEGWFVAEVTDEFLDSLVVESEDPPSDDIKERCLLKLRAKFQDVMGRRANDLRDLVRESSVGNREKRLRLKHTKRLSLGKEKV